jgi:cytochrome c oxidase subunit 1/cytochrome c oxidase subunit I+III
VLLVINLLRSGLRGAPAGPNPWNAWTLEWATSSPPPIHNFDTLPPLHSRRPLWDLAHPEAPDPQVGSDATLAVNRSRVSVWSFIGSEAAFFGTLLLVFVFFNWSPGPGASARNSLDLGRTLIFSACLFASSFTLWLAERAEHAGRQGALKTWLGATLLLGGIFIVGQASEYWGLYHSGVGVSANLFASTFYLLTGFHGFHVICGLIALAIMFGLIAAGDYRGRISPLRAVGLYWHFVDVVWVFVLTTVYILPRIL